MTVRSFTMMAIGSLVGLCMILGVRQYETSLRLTKVKAGLQEMKAAALRQGYVFTKPFPSTLEPCPIREAKAALHYVRITGGSGAQDDVAVVGDTCEVKK